MKIYIDAYLTKNLGDDLLVKILVDKYSKQSNLYISEKGKYLKLSGVNYIKENFIYKLINKVLNKMTKNKFYIVNHKIKKMDVKIIIGGSLFMEMSSRDAKSKIIKDCKNYCIIGSNFGPYKSIEYKQKYEKYFSEAIDVCFRDEYSYNLFKEIPTTRCATDIVFSLNTNNIKLTDRKRAIISIIDCSKKLDSQYVQFYEDKILTLIKFLVKKNYEVCLMSFCKSEGDEEATNSILKKIEEEKISGKIQKYFYDGNINQALNELGDSQIIIGTRFHANILGLIMRKTVIPIAYSDKTLNVLRDIKFDGKYFDIRDKKNFNVELLTEDDLHYKFNVDNQKEKANLNFKILDEIVGENNVSI